jgi:hypothetical protein
MNHFHQEPDNSDRRGASPNLRWSTNQPDLTQIWAQTSATIDIRC